MGGCASSSSAGEIIDQVAPLPRRSPGPHPTNPSTCRSFFCLSSAAVDVPQPTSQMGKVQEEDGLSGPPTRPRGRFFDICENPLDSLTNSARSTRTLTKIREAVEPGSSHTRMQGKKAVMEMRKSELLKAEEESPRRESSVPKLPPLFMPRPTRDCQLQDFDQESWDALLVDKQRKGCSNLQRSRLDIPPRPISRATITRDMTKSHPEHKAWSHKANVVWMASSDLTGKLTNICDIAFLGPNIIAVSQDSAHKTGVQLYDITRDAFPGKLIGEPDVKPRGLCSDRDGHIVVADAHSQTVKFMDIYGTRLASWKPQKFHLPAGIARTRDGQFVVSDERGGDKAIGMYSSQGSVIRKFGMPWFDCPWYVAVDNYNRILVSEQSASGIVVFDNHGHYLFRFGASGGGESQLNFQSGIVVNSKNQVLVADSDNYRVSLFSADGIFMENVVTHLPLRPISLALQEAAQAMLAIATESTIYLYHM